MFNKKSSQDSQNFCLNGGDLVGCNNCENFI